MGKDLTSLAEMPEITAYSMTVGASRDVANSSAGPFFDAEPNPTYMLGQQAQIQVWPDVDQETKEEMERKYDLHQAMVADKLKEKVFGDEEETETEEEESMKKRALRVVQIFIADRHPDVPLEKAIVYQSAEPFATDMTNQELYFTIPLMDLLAAHNAERVTWPDKESTKQSGKEVMLEEIRIGDLDMQVTAFTEFA